jgi:hypothetical protein
MLFVGDDNEVGGFPAGSAASGSEQSSTARAASSEKLGACAPVGY